jgi:hypothetical protein
MRDIEQTRMEVIQKYRILVLLFIVWASAGIIRAQAPVGGRYVYEFLGLPASARLSALGGTLPAVKDDDLNLAISNPALLNPAMHNALSFSHNFIFADIQSGYVTYGRHWKKQNITTKIGVQYVNYGDFTASDERGNINGTFSAGEAALVLGAGKQLNERIFFGAILKTVFSNYETYHSFGMAADVGLSYVKDSSGLIISLVLKNIGGEISTFTSVRGSAPLDFQVGISKRLKYLPFRFSVTGHHLHIPNIRYDDPSLSQPTDLFGAPVKENKFENFVDNLFRHLIFSGEFLLGKNENLRLRLGYNHLRRRELTLASIPNLAGFSAGFGIKVNVFRLDYGVGYHHLAGANNHLTISTNLDRFGKKI